SHRLAGGEWVELEPPEQAKSELEPETMELRIVYEDEHLLVVDKPAGLVVHPAAGHATGTLVHGLLGHAVAGGDEPERPGIVHRLDRDTSGIMVVARSAEAHRRPQSRSPAREWRRSRRSRRLSPPRSKPREAPSGRLLNPAIRPARTL